MSINESNLKIAITNIKGIPEGIRADFNIFIYHSFTEVNLPAIKSEIAPTIDFNNLEITAIFKFFYNITICTSARYINLTRTFHSKCLMRAYIIVLITPHLQLFISIINIIEPLTPGITILAAAIQPSTNIKITLPKLNAISFVISIITSPSNYYLSFNYIIP